MKSIIFALGLLTAAFAQTNCDQYGSISRNGFTISNNKWGQSSGNGWQCITADNISGSGVAWHADWQWSNGQNNVKSYPNVQRDLPQKRLLNQIGSMPSSADWSYTGSNLRLDVAYDLFTASDPNHATYFGDFELMIWLARYGGVGPIGSSQGHVNIGGLDWELFYGYNGAMQVYSFVAPSPRNNWNGDVKNFYNWLGQNRGYPVNNQYLLSFQFGTEPFTGDSATFHVNNWTGSVN
ncbi:Endoglucanase-1 [Cladobotryum mycophilum]|uniref:Endoglucanase-1 n=1 Tax=Cladobotryum mycophilum TaxID=491253 RepID=A0ABR0SN03_9HYPO